MIKLRNKTALITGGAKRLGQAVALTLANAGADIIIQYRSSASEAEETTEQIRRLGRKAWTIQADFANPEAASTLINRALAQSGKLDILINNASTFNQTSFDTFTFEDLTQDLAVNAWSPFELARNFVQRAESGHIVNFLDTRVVGYDWSHVAYHISKKTLELLTCEMALRFAPNFTVNAVAPGLVLPPEGKDVAYLESLKGILPLQRIGSPADIADAVLFLVTSSFITGQTIFIDGGRHIRENPNG